MRTFSEKQKYLEAIPALISQNAASEDFLESLESSRLRTINNSSDSDVSASGGPTNFMNSAIKTGFYISLVVWLGGKIAYRLFDSGFDPNIENFMIVTDVAGFLAIGIAMLWLLRFLIRGTFIERTIRRNSNTK